MLSQDRIVSVFLVLFSFVEMILILMLDSFFLDSLTCTPHSTILIHAHAIFFPSYYSWIRSFRGRSIPNDDPVVVICNNEFDDMFL